eukprot:357464-Chlamydomonas_euryale.AAC.5
MDSTEHFHRALYGIMQPKSYRRRRPCGGAGVLPTVCGQVGHRQALRRACAAAGGVGLARSGPLPAPGLGIRAEDHSWPMVDHCANPSIEVAEHDSGRLVCVWRAGGIAVRESQPLRRRIGRSSQLCFALVIARNPWLTKRCPKHVHTSVIHYVPSGSTHSSPPPRPLHTTGKKRMYAAGAFSAFGRFLLLPNTT